MATLNPEMGISGQDALASLTDVLQEITPAKASDDEKNTNVVTDEIEEKDIGIQMLSVFIDEVGEACYDYVEQISKILLSVVDYSANDSIRSSAAIALPGLIKAAKARGVAQDQIHSMARVYNEKIFKALEEEFDTDTRIPQIQALKEIIDEAGPGLFTADEVNHLGNKAIEHVDKSNQRIGDNKEYSKQEQEDEDDELDAEDIALLKAENQNEYDLQTAAAEILGALFKTHKEFVADLVNKCKTEVIPAAMQSGEVKRYRFSLFILDDMVEHLGPSYFSAEDWFTIVTTICQYCDH